MKTIYTFGKSKSLIATQIITGELEEQPLKPNSNIGSTPLYYYA
jgi:hypothetical protein